MRVGKNHVYESHNLVPIPDSGSFIYIYKLAASNTVYGMKSDGNYFPIGSSSASFEDSDTIEFYTGPGGLLTASTKITSSLSVVKSLTTAGTLYCPKTSAIAPDNARYDSPEQAKINNQLFSGYSVPVETGVMIDSFDEASGQVTIPEDGLYNVNFLLGYRMQNSDFHTFTSDGANVAMTGNYWVAAPGDVGSIAVALMTVSGPNNLYLYSQKIVNQEVNNVYLAASGIVRLTAGLILAAYHINDSNLPMYGCVNSVFSLNIVKISD